MQNGENATEGETTEDMEDNDISEHKDNVREYSEHENITDGIESGKESDSGSDSEDDGEE